MLCPPPLLAVPPRDEAAGPALFQPAAGAAAAPAAALRQRAQTRAGGCIAGGGAACNVLLGGAGFPVQKCMQRALRSPARCMRDLCNVVLWGALCSPRAKCMHRGIFATCCWGMQGSLPMQNACMEGSLQCGCWGVQCSPCKMHAPGPAFPCKLHAQRDPCNALLRGCSLPRAKCMHGGISAAQCREVQPSPCQMHTQGPAQCMHRAGRCSCMPEALSHTPPPPPCRSLPGTFAEAAAAQRAAPELRHGEGGGAVCSSALCKDQRGPRAAAAAPGGEERSAALRLQPRPCCKEPRR